MFKRLLLSAPLFAGLLLAFSLTGCRTGSISRSPAEAEARRENAPASAGPGAPNGMDWIRVSRDQRGFELQRSRRPFIPWGFNYDRDYRFRLLEDYWESEWDTVVEDFREMKQLGANTVRIHLQFARFMDAPNRPNAQALGQLERLVKLAEETGLYLDLTGLACYRKSDVPAWYTSLDESKRWKAQARFWEAIAARCAGSAAILCYDLMNEPIVPAGKRAPGDWLTGELGGFAYCQYISLAQADRPRPEIARRWVATLAAAIRKHDRRHLITLGFLPNSLETPVSESGFAPGTVAGPLDYLSVHIYPRTAHFQEDLKTLEGFNIGKPLVIEEIFPMYCGSAELRKFFADSKPYAAGWLGFYWGQTPAELEKAATVNSAILGDWLKTFQEMNYGAEKQE